MLIAMLAAAAHAEDAKPRGEWQIDVGVAARETYTDNVALTSANRQSDFVTDISPYFTAKKEGGRLKVNARYSMQNLYYLNDANRNTIYHQLAANANAELLDKNLFLDVAASASQQATSVIGATGIDNTTATGNTTSIYTLTVSPYWVQRIGSYANVYARYLHSDNTGSGNSFFASTSDGVNLSINSGSQFNQLIWGLNYSDQQTNYDKRPDVGFSTTSATLGYLLTEHVRATVTGGYEDNQYQATTTGSPSGSFWDAHVAYNPSQQSRFDLGYGHHYYGNSWSGNFSSRTPHLDWSLAYSERVTTSASQFATQGLTNLTGTNLFYLTNRQLATNTVYLNKEWRGAVNYHKGRGTLGLALYRQQQISQESYNGTSSSFFGTDPITGQNVTATTQTGADLTLGWKLSPHTSSSLRLGVSRNSYTLTSTGTTTQPRNDRTNVAEVGVSHEFQRNVNGGLSVRHQTRSSDQANADFSESAITASVSAQF